MNFDKLEYYRYNGSKDLPPSQGSNSGNLKEKLESFLNGDASVLDTPGLIEIVAHFIITLYHQGEIKQSLFILEQLGESALSEDIALRERSLIVLSMVAEKVLEENNKDLLEAISQMLMRWLKSENEYITGFEIVCLQLSKLLQKMIALGLWYEAEDLIVVLRDIKKGAIQKNKLLRQIIAKTHGTIAEKEYIDKLIKSYINKGDDKSNVAGNLLVQLGEKSSLRLLQILSQCQDKSQRFRLIDLIPEAGNDAIAPLMKGLNNKLPWYVIRNVILMLSKVADPALLKSIKPFLKHKDIRVQTEAVYCINAMGGEEKTTRLLEALNVCDHGLKPQIIGLLGPLKEKRIGNTFIGLLNNHSIFKNELRDEIIEEICKFLPVHANEKSLLALSNLLSDENAEKNFSKKTLEIVGQTRDVLQKNIASSSLPDLKDIADPGNDSDTAVIKKAVPVSNSIQKISLKNPSVSSDDWFKEVTEDPDIPAPLRKHLLRRKGFYILMNQEEFIAFSALLAHQSFKKGDIITAIGDVHSTLFFIEEGKVGFHMKEDNSQTCLSPLQMGDLIGNEVFMNGSEWTVTLKAEDDVEAFLFDQEQLLKLQPQYPSLCKKILEYCKQNDIILKLYRSVSEKLDILPEGETIPFTGDIGDHIADAWIIDYNSYGLCFCFPLPNGIDHNLFADKELRIFLEQNSIKPVEIRAQSLGLKFFEEKNRKLCIFARFAEETDLTRYRCTSISLESLY